MVERGSWSLCQVLAFLSKSADFASSSDYQKVFDLNEEVPEGYYPFNSVFKIKNASTSDDLYVQVKDSNGNEIDSFVISPSSLAIVVYSALKDLIVYAKNSSGSLTCNMFLSQVFEQ